MDAFYFRFLCAFLCVMDRLVRNLGILKTYYDGLAILFSPHCQIGFNCLDVGRPVRDLDRGHVLDGVVLDGGNERSLGVLLIKQLEGPVGQFLKSFVVTAALLK
jgi:hypothetical protein